MNLLKELVAITATGEFEDNGGIDIASAHWRPRGLTLTLEVDHGTGELSSWSVHCDEVLEYHLSSAFDCGLDIWDASHPAIDQYVQQTERLTFATAAREPARVIGELWMAHRAAVDDWIPFDRYLNAELPLHILLASNGGELAKGPAFLLEVYERVLNEHGCRPSRVGSKEGAAEKASFIHFGESYVVARTFKAERNAG